MMEIIFSGLQALAAIATFIIACVAFRQGKKIKTLTDVVTELKAQNEIMEKTFVVERMASLYNIYPIFRKSEKINNGPDKAIMVLENIGVAAKEVSTKESIDAHFKVHLFEHSVDKLGKIKIEISMKDGSPLENIEFYVLAVAHSGVECRQLIFKTPQHDLNIAFPEYDAKLP